MKFDLGKASRMLSELDLKISSDNCIIDVLWFRVMRESGSWIINRHTHSTYEFHFISSGSCKVVLEDGEFTVSAGEFYLTAPGIYHEQMGTGEVTEYCINCDIKLIKDMPCEALHILKVLAETPCKPVKDNEGITALFYKALLEAYHQNIGFYNNIKNLAALIVFSAARAIAGSANVKYEIPLKNKTDDYRFAQIAEFISDNIYNRLSTNDVAKYMFLSEKQVCRIVKKFRGISTKELIESSKFQKAKELLIQSDFSIKQISDQLGFSSEYYFNQFFKRLEGYPPGIFRSNTRH